QEGAVELGAWVADPHPGNFLITPQGVVAFLDFGCLEPVPDRAGLARFLQAAKAGNGQEIDAAGEPLFGQQGPAGRQLLRLLVAPAAVAPGELLVSPALLKELAQVMPVAKEEGMRRGTPLSPTLPLYCRLALVLLADLAALGARRPR
ncbi:MAG TPA: AarF/UbiB family protein, partial [Myxococcota bacterium]|nr:AarF/UbiB family protein [Myxococcota bacterium]